MIKKNTRKKSSKKFSQTYILNEHKVQHQINDGSIELAKEGWETFGFKLKLSTKIASRKHYVLVYQKKWKGKDVQKYVILTEI